MQLAPAANYNLYPQLFKRNPDIFILQIPADVRDREHNDLLENFVRCPTRKGVIE